MSTIIPLENKELPQNCWVFKHSSTCPVSARAASEIQASTSPAVIYQIGVREQRELSSWVADTYGVRHESPQLIFIKDGKARQVWNHGEIRRGVLST